MARAQTGHRTDAPAGFTLETVYRTEVSTKELWADEWTIRPKLEPIKSVWAVPPLLSTATLRHNYGNIVNTGDDAFAEVEPLDIRDHYIKIETSVARRDTPGADNQIDVTKPIGTWVGLIVEDNRSPLGKNASAGIDEGNAGLQRLTAYGLEHLLRKLPIDATAIRDNDEDKLIPTRVVFNQRVPRGPLSGNMFATVTDDTPAFTSDPEFATPPLLDTATTWALPDIVRYILGNFVTGRTGPDFRLAVGNSGPQSTSASGDDTPAEFVGFNAIIRIEDLFGLTAWDALNKILDRRRGLGWYISTDGEGTIDVNLFTVLTKPLKVLGSSGTIVVPANANQITYALDDDDLVIDDGLQVRENFNRLYKNVHVRGAPIVVVFTAGYADGSLEEGWSFPRFTAYREAAINNSGYSALSNADKMVLNDKQRTEDETLGRVYLRHVIPLDWDWAQALPFGGTGDRVLSILPDVDARGNVRITPAVPDSTSYLTSFKRLLPWLPLLEDVDYSASTLDTTDASTRLMAPFAIVRRGNRYFRTDTMKGVDGIEVELPRVSMRMLEDRMGFDLILAGSRHQPHSWAYLDVPVSDLQLEENAQLWRPSSSAVSSVVNQEFNAVNYRRMFATLAVETDRRPSVIFQPVIFTENDTALYIDFPDIQYWHAAFLTVTGVFNDGTPRFLNRNNRPLRDDTPLLRVLGAFIQAWYTNPRRTVDLTWRSFDFLEPGSLLMSISASQPDQIETVVTQVEWDYLDTTTRIVTEFANLDFGAAFGLRANVS